MQTKQVTLLVPTSAEKTVHVGSQKTWAFRVVSVKVHPVKLHIDFSKIVAGQKRLRGLYANSPNPPKNEFVVATSYHPSGTVKYSNT